MISAINEDLLVQLLLFIVLFVSGEFGEYGAFRKGGVCDCNSSSSKQQHTDNTAHSKCTGQ